MFISVILLLSLTSKALAAVSCGNHQASTCGECPQGNGVAWCNGDCSWINNTCTMIMPTKSNPYACDGSGKCKTRTSSVHLTSFFSQPASAIYRDIVPTSSSNATYFAILDHDHGYGGIQMSNANPKYGDIVICSIWDQATPTTIKTCGTGVKCENFGGEGTGRKAMWAFNWKMGDRYGMLHTRKLVGNKMEHQCWFHAPELSTVPAKRWKLIATFLSDPQGRSSTFNDAGSFIEQWIPEKGHIPRTAQFGSYWFRLASTGSWTQSRTTTFGPYCPQDQIDSGNETCVFVSAKRMVNRVSMSTGGIVKSKSSASKSQSFTLSPELRPAALTAWIRR